MNGEQRQSRTRQTKEIGRKKMASQIEELDGLNEEEYDADTTGTIDAKVDEENVTVTVNAKDSDLNILKQFKNRLTFCDRPIYSMNKK